MEMAVLHGPSPSRTWTITLISDAVCNSWLLLYVRKVFVHLGEGMTRLSSWQCSAVQTLSPSPLPPIRVACCTT